MKLKITLLLAVTALMGFFAGVAFSGGSPSQAPVMVIDHDKVAAAFAKGSVTVIETNNFKVMAGRREAAGTAEIHELDTDIFYVLEGTATFVTGGSVPGATNSGPHEIRGPSVTGGEAHKLVKGDIIVIPNNVPHWFKEASNPFLYYVVKVSK